MRPTLMPKQHQRAPQRAAPTPRRQRGVSLIELLIGLTIGLLVAVAAVGSLVYTKVSSTTVGDSSRLQQDASTAFRIMGHQVRQAGARRLQNATGGKVQFNPTYQGLSTTTFVILDGTEGTSNGTDTLVVSYDVEPTIDARDCLGQTPAGTLVRSTFRVVGRELQCQGSATSATFQALISGVEDMQVLYGVRTGDDLRYRVASDVPDWGLVESVQVCLRLVGDVAGTPTVAATTPGCVAGQTVNSDGRIRRVFTQVFNLRNVGL